MLCIYGEVTRVGRTSMGIELEAWVLRGNQAERAKVTEGTFTFVALDENAQPRPVDP